MNSELNRALMVSPPSDIGRTANDFGVLKFTAETTHAANAIPDSFKGKWVRLRAIGGIVHFGFSENSAAEIDRAVVATAAGASAKVGGILANGAGSYEDFKIQDPGTNTTIYFVRESDTASTIVYMQLTPPR